MSQQVKPCAYCGNGTFHYMPDIIVHVGHAASILGMAADVGRHYWQFTLVVCTQCGCTQTFTTNAPQLSQRVPGSCIVPQHG